MFLWFIINKTKIQEKNMIKKFLFPSIILIATIAMTGFSLPETIKNHWSYKYIKFHVVENDWENKKITSSPRFQIL